MAFDKLKGFMDQAKNAAVQHLGQDTIDDAKSKLDKLKDLMGNAMDDAKDVAVEHLGQETVDEAICAMGKLKDLVGDTVHSAVEYLEQDSVERAIAKMERQKEDAPAKEAKKLAQEAAAKEAQDKQKLKRAAELLAGDFDETNKGDVFFINNNYDEPYTQSEWAELYKKLKLEKDPQALVPMYNAVVVNSKGYFRRRGLNLDKYSFKICAYKGIGDKIEPEHAIEPYTYHKRLEFQESKIWNALMEKYPNWLYAYRPTDSSSGASSGSYSGASMGSGPAPSRGLSSTEKAELDRAKRKYEDAVARASYHRGDKVKTSVYDDAEKRAHAEYMRVLAKYSGRG